MQKRIKSPVFWCSLVMLVAEGLKLFGVYEISNENISAIQDIITMGFGIFASLNNPTNKVGF